MLLISTKIDDIGHKGAVTSNFEFHVISEIWEATKELKK